MNFVPDENKVKKWLQPKIIHSLLLNPMFVEYKIILSIRTSDIADRWIDYNYCNNYWFASSRGNDKNFDVQPKH